MQARRVFPLPPGRPRRALTAVLSTAAFLCAVVLLVPSVARADDVNIALEAKGGKAVGEVKVVRLKRDDQVALSIVSDRADEVHVHGYDLKLKLEPNKPAALQFVARRTGRFAIELHKSGAEIGVLEIYPK
jgi:ferric-dicitrate binding protein FerR (iron transport regulator)